MTTLVLNQSYMPIGIEHWTKSIKKIVKEKAEVLEEYTESKLNEWSALNAPAVIRLLHFINPPRKANRYMPLTRKNVWLRDKGVCQYCGDFVSMKQMTWDHIIPRVQGGRTTWTNIVVACQKCNAKKEGRTPDEAKMKLRSRPIAPIYKMSKEKEMILRLKSLKNLPHENWRNYIYFNIELDP